MPESVPSPENAIRLLENWLIRMEDIITSWGNILVVHLWSWLTVVLVALGGGLFFVFFLLVVFLRILRKGPPINEVETPAHWLENLKS